MAGFEVTTEGSRYQEMWSGFIYLHCKFIQRDDHLLTPDEVNYFLDKEAGLETYTFDENSGTVIETSPSGHCLIQTLT